ncbi:hypothetical protein, partial [Mesorhizobium sp. M1A.F.Ca.IN.020.03.1.1]|uniref:hypothetical protein n=1 Tax=Mesorhizobium sp. M1A.F.Ca.IN.020.03.1.1 TaxID=2496764 RepID=UPI0019D21763
LGMMTVPSSLRVQPLAASSAGQRTKVSIRPSISYTPTDFIARQRWVRQRTDYRSEVGPASA